MFLSTIILHLLFSGPMGLASAAPVPQDETPEITPEITIVQDDLNFAVSLAKHRYFDLANEFVDLIKNEQLSKEEKSSLLLTNASILKLASENAADDKDRLNYYKEAIALFTEFVNYNTDHPQYDQSRLDLARVQVNLGRFLNEMMMLTEDPEKRASYQEEAKASFSKGIELFKDLQRVFRNNTEAYENSGEQDLADETKNLYRRTTYEMGVAYYYWGLILDPDEFNREDYLERAIDTLDDYIWESSEDDFYALWAYIHQSMAYMELKNYGDALDLAKQVYDPQTGVDLDQAKNLSPEYAKLITDITETAYFQVTLIYTKMGEYEKADETVEDMIERFSSKELELSSIGDQARLAQAKALLELGEPEKADKAAQICKEVGDRNPANNVGREAKIVLKSIIDSVGTAGGSSAAFNLSPGVLFAAAEGAKLERNFLEAIQAYMKVLAALDTKELKNEFLAKTWFAVGFCYTQLRRHLEASVAYEQGFTDPDKGPDDQTFEANAMNWYSALTQRHKETKDPYDEKKKKDARNRLVQLNVSTDLRYMIANDKFTKAATLTGEERDQALKEAMEEYSQMDKQSSLYETSLVYVARCYHEMGKYDAALKAFDEFQQYINRVGIPGSPKQKANRKKALAEGIYWRAENYLKMERYEDALRTLEGFEDEFKAQADFVPAVIFDRLLAKIGLNDFKAAEKLYQELDANYPDSVRTSMAAYKLGFHYNDKADALRGDPESQPTAEYIETRKKCAEYMYIYCEKSNFDSFQNLKHVCEWYQELGDNGVEDGWQTSRTYFEKLLKEFSKQPQYKEEIDDIVNRRYGEVLLSLKDFQTAKPVWLRLLNANRKSIGVLRSTATCLGGWLEYDRGTYVEIPGAGVYAPDPNEQRDPKKVYLDTALGIWNYILGGIDDAGNKYSEEWWEAKFNSIYVLYRAGEQYPVYYDHASQVIENQKLFRPELGGPEMKKKFNYLEKALKKSR
ncbi:MAG: tetratricopeptide repeat protein [Planctomycetes bacterium]|nr:tetratricopeptide repeat protein [Planctomycetota bacterium]